VITARPTIATTTDTPAPPPVTIPITQKPSLDICQDYADEYSKYCVNCEDARGALDVPTFCSLFTTKCKPSTPAANCATATGSIPSAGVTQTFTPSTTWATDATTTEEVNTKTTPWATSTTQGPVVTASTQGPVVTSSTQGPVVTASTQGPVVTTTTAGAGVTPTKEQLCAQLMDKFNTECNIAQVSDASVDFCTAFLTDCNVAL
jgi:hypothetical protein